MIIDILLCISKMPLVNEGFSTAGSLSSLFEYAAVRGSHIRYHTSNVTPSTAASTFVSVEYVTDIKKNLNI